MKNALRDEMKNALLKAGIIKNEEQKITEMLSFAEARENNNKGTFFELYGSEHVEKLFYFNFDRDMITFEKSRLVGTCDLLTEIIWSPGESTKRTRKQKGEKFSYQDITEEEIVDQLYHLFVKEILAERYSRG